MNILSFESIAYVFVVIFLYFIIKRKYRPKYLLVVSLLFYFQNNHLNILFLLLTSLSVFFAAKYFTSLEEKYDKKTEEFEESNEENIKLLIKRKNKIKKRIVTLVIILNLFSLFYFKYTNALILLFNKFFEGQKIGFLELALPLGISFYTFQAIGYLIDVYRGKQKHEKSYFNLLLFLSYFPQVIQGPIARYDELMPQLKTPHGFNYERFLSGALLILWGYAKKLLIAEGLAVMVNKILGAPSTYNGLYIFIAISMYAIQIYADFSGGIDIVSGISEIIGIKLTRNFKRPFFATSLSDFWRRWHITLGSWMRDYVFYPVAFSPIIIKFNKILKKKNKKLAKILPSALASMVVFFLVGLWHGASFKYIAFGLYNGIIITFSLLMEGTYKKIISKLGIKTDKFDWKIVQIFRTLIVVTFGRYFTRAASFTGAIYLFKQTFSKFNPYIIIDGSFFNLGLSPFKILALIISIIILFGVEIVQESGIDVRRKIVKSNYLVRLSVFLLLSISVIVFGYYGESVDTSNFIYQGF